MKNIIIISCVIGLSACADKPKNIVVADQDVSSSNQTLHLDEKARSNLLVFMDTGNLIANRNVVRAGNAQ